MKSFLLSVIKQIFVFIIAGFVVVGLVFVLILTLISGIDHTPVHIPKDSILVIDLAINITDAQIEESFSEYFNDFIESDKVQTTYLLELLDAIEAASQDPRIVGILLKGNSSYSQQSGYPLLHEVQKAIADFKKTGKLVVSHFVHANVKDYFLSSTANIITLNPLGQLSLKGLALEMAYLGDAFEKYGIGMQITKSGKYKSAVEPFTSNHMSDFEREQMTTLLGDLWDNISEIIAENRNINKNELKDLSANSALFLATEAKHYNLIDAIEYEDQVIDRFNLEKMTVEEVSNHKINLKKYIRDLKNKKLLKKVTQHKPKVTIVYVEGEILEGEGSSFNAGADRLQHALQELTEDTNVKAIVLRVNSPGGGANASEKILRAVRTLGTKKPIVASFGNYAASGGYWISCYANAIFTDPMSITGSIGVFGLLPNIEKIANNHGINFESISTGSLGTIDSFLKPRTQAELAKFQDYTNLIYHAFLERVVEGRKLEMKIVEEVADGRVWSGLKAKQLGLADFYGGLKDAIKHAAELANLGDNWEISQYAHKRGLNYDLFHFFQESTNIKLFPDRFIGKYLRLFEKEIENFNNLNDPNSTYARIPFLFVKN